ncbi:MFS sugar transporter [Chloropicon primus]|uniref:MFS sugar transporter n=1 Tax=Chloropicon primus TaxID=1764295 RepID=A0A5B8MPF6_9CHLO|nr:MFS sugar transporter [Chloropicon primus]|eukprot:QDZ22558.1 MFS sugar transporter [Chloropicon primus]
MGNSSLRRKGGGEGASWEDLRSLEQEPLTRSSPSSTSSSRTSPTGKRRVLTAFAFAALAGSLFGYDIGSTAVALTQEQALGDFDIEENSWKQGMLVSCSLYGALVASLSLFALGEVLGRRQEVLLANGAYLLGSVGSVVPPSHTTFGLILLMASRFVYGTGIGLAMHSAPAYVAEIAPQAMRGLLIAMKEAMIVLGILLGYCAGSVFSSPGGWRSIWGLASPLALVSLVGMAFQHESPRWLASRSVRKAEESLRYFRAQDAVGEEIDGIVAALEVPDPSSSIWSKISEIWSVRKAFFIGGGLLLLQQVSGQPAVLYFAPTIFTNAGLGTETSKLASVLVGVVKLFATVVASLKVDSFGRVPLLLCGISLMFLALVALALTTAMWQTPSGSRLVIFELMALVTAYQIGFGPISWLILTEVSPLRVRGNMVGLGVSVNFLFNIVATQTLPIINNAVGMSGLFGIYAVVALLSLGFVRFFVPETKGRSLEEIEVLLGLSRGGGGTAA